MRRMLLTVVVVAFTLGSTGCLVTSSSSVEEMGTRVSDASLNQIVLGETTEAWILATLGEPEVRTNVDGVEGVSVLRYDYTVSRRSGGTVFLLFGGKSNSTRTTRTFFEITDGVVSRYWVEH